MVRALADYLQQMQALLPRGDAWSHEPDNVLTKLLTALAKEFSRVDARASDILDEADPRTTYELLIDWERVAGLPDTCTDQVDTLQERRDALVSKLTSIGNQSRQYFIDIAAALGYTITITEYRPYFVNTAINMPINDETWRFVWSVNAPEETIRSMTVNSEVDMPLRDWGNEQLECLINKFKPAHTHALFAYGG